MCVRPSITCFISNKLLTSVILYPSEWGYFCINKLPDMDTTTVIPAENKKEGNNLYPNVTLILPLVGENFSTHLNEVCTKLITELQTQYIHKADAVIEMIASLHNNIDNNKGKKTVAVFLSPVQEKIFYLDVSLDEHIFVDEHYELRDLINSMNNTDKYLLLVQSYDFYKIYLGDRFQLLRINLTHPSTIESFTNDIAEKIEYFTDTVDRKEIMMDKFIHHIDKELDILLKQHNLPLFVVGPERMNGHFKKITHHGASVLDYVHGNYNEAKPHQLLNLILPHLKEIKTKENNLLAADIEHALNANKLRFGIEEVWGCLMEQKGKTLLVERNYTYPCLIDKDGYLDANIDKARKADIKDAIDLIIEKVILSGGTVKFTDSDILVDFRRIALFLYY